MANDTQLNRRAGRVIRSMRTRTLPLLLVAALVLVAGSAAAGRDPGNGDTTRGGRSPVEIEDDVHVLIEDVLESTGRLARHDDSSSESDSESDSDSEDSESEELTIETLKFFIEFNETDEDIGVQCVLGGEPYKVLRAFGPNERRILDLRPRRALKKQGMSDFFFESAEPTLDEFALEDFLDRFPEGEYEFETITIDGLEQDGEAMLTHLIPAGPVITSPYEGEEVDPEDVVVTWEPVTMTTAFDPPQQPVKIVGYQVIVTREDPLRIFSVDVSAETTEVSVPPEFLDPGTEYELEILAVEESDNQTISILFFETEEAD